MTTLNPRRPMTFGETLEMFCLKVAGFPATTIAADLKRHPNTVRTWLALGPDGAVKRLQQIRAALSTGQSGLAIAAARESQARELRPPHVTARHGTARWYTQQHQAFVAAMKRCHPEIEHFADDRCVNVRGRISEARRIGGATMSTDETDSMKAVDDLIATLGAHFAVAAPDPGRFADDLRSALVEGRFEPSTLEATGRAIIRTRRSRLHPSVGAVVAECERIATGGDDRAPAGSIEIRPSDASWERWIAVLAGAGDMRAATAQHEGRLIVPSRWPPPRMPRQGFSSGACA